MKYKRNTKRHSVSGRGKYMSTADFIQEYYCNIEKCRQFFFEAKWPDGYMCEKCGNTHYYYMKGHKVYRCSKCKHEESVIAHTVFEQCKLALNVLLYGIFLIFSSKNGISSENLAAELKINYKTACLLNTKCRILMRESNSEKRLDSKFYESDVAYIGSSTEGKPGLSTDKQPVLFVLSTDQKNQYPRHIKLREIEVDNMDNIKEFFEQYVFVREDATLTTDGKNTVNFLKNEMIVDNKKIDYDKPNHNLWFLNICISNFKSMVVGTYHGIDKRMLPLYLSEYEWRFNHRTTRNYLSKIKKYIQKSMSMKKTSIQNAMTIYYAQRMNLA